MNSEQFTRAVMIRYAAKSEKAQNYLEIDKRLDKLLDFLEEITLNRERYRIPRLKYVRFNRSIYKVELYNLKGKMIEETYKGTKLSSMIQDLFFNNYYMLLKALEANIGELEKIGYTIKIGDPKESDITIEF